MTDEPATVDASESTDWPVAGESARSIIGRKAVGLLGGAALLSTTALLSPTAVKLPPYTAD